MGSFIVYDYLINYMASSIIYTDLIFEKGAQRSVISVHIFKEVQASNNIDRKHCLNTESLNRCCPSELQDILMNLGDQHTAL